LIDPWDIGHGCAAGSARLVLTDSGGLQKEAYWLGFPASHARRNGMGRTVGAALGMFGGSDSDKIVDAVSSFSPPDSRPALYGDGARRISVWISLGRTRAK